MRFPGLAAVIFLISAAAQAEDAPVPAPPLTPPEVTLFNFGASNPACNTWSNGCQICLRLVDGKPICSTPGIACTPAEPACTASKVP